MPQLVYREGETDETTIDGSFERTARALVLKKARKRKRLFCEKKTEERGLFDHNKQRQVTPACAKSGRAITLFKIIFDIVIVHDDVESVIVIIVVKS